jgi:hypothetical protein
MGARSNSALPAQKGKVNRAGFGVLHRLGMPKPTRMHKCKVFAATPGGGEGRRELGREMEEGRAGAGGRRDGRDGGGGGEGGQRCQIQDNFAQHPGAEACSIRVKRAIASRFESRRNWSTKHRIELVRI